MADERKATEKLDSSLETPTDTTGETANTIAFRDAAREQNADAAIRQETARDRVADLQLQKEAAIEAAVDTARERDLASAAASRLATERNNAAEMAAVESTVANENAFGFWMMVAIVVAILVVGMAWAAMTRPWESQQRDLNTAVPPAAATAATGQTGAAPNTAPAPSGR